MAYNHHRVTCLRNARLPLVACLLLAPTLAFTADVSVTLYSDSGTAIHEGTVRIYKADEDGYAKGEPIRTKTVKEGDKKAGFDFRLGDGEYVIDASLTGFLVTRLPFRVDSASMVVRVGLKLGALGHYDYADLSRKNGRWYAGENQELLRNIEERFAILDGHVRGSNIEGRRLWLKIDPFLQSTSRHPFEPFTADVGSDGRFDFGYVETQLYILHVFEDSKEEFGVPTLLHSQLVQAHGEPIQIEID